MGSRRRSEALTRFQERRQREHDAARLRARIPTLATLRLDIVEGHGHTQADPKHARIITVETSPALFELGCGDRSCRDGGHDVTSAVLRGLLDRKTHFTIDQRCTGTVGSVGCDRDMHIEVSATYQEQPVSGA